MNPAKVILSGLACTSFAFASVPKEARAQLTEIYGNLTKAFVQKNIAPYEKVMAKDFTVTDKKGKIITRDIIIRDYKGQMAHLKNPTWKRTLTDLTGQGGNVVVTVKSDIQGGLQGGDGKFHKLQIFATAKDTWTRQGTRWILLKTKLVSTTPLMDGHPASLR